MEQEWIGRIKTGETHLFGELYKLHAPKVFSLCFRFTGNKDDAEEQLQEIFMKLFDKIHQFKGQSAFSTWLHRLCVNHLLNHKDHKNRRREDAFDAVSHEEGKLETPDLKLALENAIVQLPTGLRHVFILHDQEGFCHEEIASILNCSASNSRAQLSRARLALRGKLLPFMAKDRAHA